MNIADFDYELPRDRIAQQPVEPRDNARLMLLDSESGRVAHHHFHELGRFLQPGDVLVLNDTRVIPARLLATRRATGGKAEILLLRQLGDLQWLGLVRGKGLRAGASLQLVGSDIDVSVREEREAGLRVLQFSKGINNELASLGHTPLPPYIRQPLTDRERYQTVYSRHEGSAAAPTAGLHFTRSLLARLKGRGVQLVYCTLHIGLDTFQPVKVDKVGDHSIHSEEAWLSPAAAAAINRAARAGGRIIAVGTTSARTLESAAASAAPGETVAAFDGNTSLFIAPGYRWRAIDGLITNFHLPRTTLLLMVCALAGREKVLRAYEMARDNGYRFYSFGDVMFIGPQTDC
ncbi:MAG: tRNA preQ1(34) S-adenosylmethionine ribosyltransferase-isomerase QueA [Anaerolineaceae bacterium]|nr:tRNA preQ1(34) S-adenosylmethionine ribosyltransferase-isomerase QueA [Anaerolineaceae bacterium]